MRWSGADTVHCAGSGHCHQSFSDVEAWDVHRRIGECVDPAVVKDAMGRPLLVPAGRAYPCWKLAG